MVRSNHVSTTPRARLSPNEFRADDSPLTCFRLKRPNTPASSTNADRSPAAHRVRPSGERSLPRRATKVFQSPRPADRTAFASDRHVAVMCWPREALSAFVASSVTWRFPASHVRPSGFSNLHPAFFCIHADTSDGTCLSPKEARLFPKCTASSAFNLASTSEPSAYAARRCSAHLARFSAERSFASARANPSHSAQETSFAETASVRYFPVMCSASLSRAGLHARPIRRPLRPAASNTNSSGLISGESTFLWTHDTTTVPCASLSPRPFSADANARTPPTFSGSNPFGPA